MRTFLWLSTAALIAAGLAIVAVADYVDRNPNSSLNRGLVRMALAWTAGNAEQPATTPAAEEPSPPPVLIGFEPEHDDSLLRELKIISELGSEPELIPVAPTEISDSKFATEADEFTPPAGESENPPTSEAESPPRRHPPAVWQTEEEFIQNLERQGLPAEKFERIGIDFDVKIGGKPRTVGASDLDVVVVPACQQCSSCGICAILCGICDCMWEFVTGLFGCNYEVEVAVCPDLPAPPPPPLPQDVQDALMLISWPRGVPPECCLPHSGISITGFAPLQAQPAPESWWLPVNEPLPDGRFTISYRRVTPGMPGAIPASVVIPAICRSPYWNPPCSLAPCQGRPQVYPCPTAPVMPPSFVQAPCPVPAAPQVYPVPMPPLPPTPALMPVHHAMPDGRFEIRSFVSHSTPGAGAQPCPPPCPAQPIVPAQYVVPQPIPPTAVCPHPVIPPAPPIMRTQYVATPICQPYPPPPHIVAIPPCGVMPPAPFAGTWKPGCEQPCNCPRTMKGFAREVTVDFKDQPLGEVLEHFRALADINIVCDKPAFDAAGVATDKPVTLKLDKVPCRVALKHALRYCGLMCKIEDDVVVVTTEECAAACFPPMVCPVPPQPFTCQAIDAAPVTQACPAAKCCVPACTKSCAKDCCEKSCGESNAVFAPRVKVAAPDGTILELQIIMTKGEPCCEPPVKQAGFKAPEGFDAGGIPLPAIVHPMDLPKAEFPEDLPRGEAFPDLIGSRWEEDGNRRARELLVVSDDLRSIYAEWERIWGTDQPSKQPAVVRVAKPVNVSERYVRVRTNVNDDTLHIGLIGLTSNPMQAILLSANLYAVPVLEMSESLYSFWYGLQR